MAKQIENRVVEMEFKNKDFEKAIAVTLDSIDQLNKKLDSLNDVNTKGFDVITKAANKVDFSALMSGLDNLENRFTTITGKIKSQIQDWVIEDVIKKPLAELEKVADTVFNTIVNKGKARSQNLAQAKFQLEALGLTWEQIYDDMDYAVSGTAYGLDEAAMAASQFAAANVKLGDDMKSALRGISGVAAMTGRSYSEIAQIFTTVAGKGKAMNGEIARIEERGLGAKKAIADFINETGALGNSIKVTTNDIFELASKGQISFEVFSKAMDTAFGEHATAANNLFTGALANTKAALGRIGERFATPIYEDLRQVLVSLIPVINDFKKNLDPIVNSVTNVTGSVREMTVSLLEFIHSAFDEDLKDRSIFEGTIDSKEVLLDVINKVADLINGIGAALNGGAASSFGMAILNTFWAVYDILSMIKEGIGEVFGMPGMSDVIRAMDKLEELTEKFEASEETLDRIERTAAGVAAALDIVYKTGDAIFKVFVIPLLKAMGLIGDDVLDMTASLGDMLVAFDKGYRPFPKLANEIDLIKFKLTHFTFTMKEVWESIKGFFEKVTDIHSFEDLFTKLEEAGQKLHIADIFYGIAGAIIFALDNLADFLDMLTGNTEFNEYIKGLVEQNKLLAWVKDTFTKIKTTIHDITSGNKTISEALGLDKLKEHFAFLNPVIEKFKEHYKSIFEAFEGEEGSEGLPFIKQFEEHLKEQILALDFETIFGMIGAAFWGYWAKKKAEFDMKIGEAVGSIANTFQKLTTGLLQPLNKAVTETQTDKVLKYAAAIALLAASVLILGSMGEDELNQAIRSLTVVMSLLTVMMGIIAFIFRSTTESYKQGERMETGIKTSGLNKNTLLSPVALLVEKVGKRFSVGSEYLKSSTVSLNNVAKTILAFGAAILLITSGIAALTKIIKGNEDEFTTATAVVAVIGLGLALFMSMMMGMVIKINNEMKKGKSIAIASQLNAIYKIILMFGIAMRLIINGLAILAVVTKFAGGDALILSLIALLAVFGTIIGSMVAIMEMFDSFKKVKPKSLLVAAGSIVMMALAIQMIAAPIALLTALFSSTAVTSEAIIAGVGSILIVLGVMTGIALAFMAFGETGTGAIAGMLAGAGSMVIMAAAINMMMVPISALTGLATVNPDSLLASVTLLGIIGAAMVALLAVFGFVGSAGGGIGAVGMLAGAAAMILMAKALTALLVPIAGVMALQKVAPSGNLGDVFKDMAIGLGILAAASVAAMLAAPLIMIFTSALVALAASVMMVGIGIKDAGQGILFFITALMLLQSINFTTLADKIAQAIAAMIKGISQSLVTGQPQIVQGFTALIGAGCSAFVSSSAMLCEAAIKLLKDVIVAIDNHAQELGFSLGHALLDIVQYALLGMWSSFFDVVDKLFGGSGGLSDTLKEMLFDDDDSKSLGKGVFNGITGLFGGFGKSEAKEATKDASKNTSEAFVENTSEEISSSENQGTLNNGLTSLFGGLDFNGIATSAGADSKLVGNSLANGSLDGTSDTLNIVGGESLEMKALANYGVDGYVNGLTDGLPKVEDASKLLASTSLNTIAKTQDSASPSKKAMELGSYFSEGYALGMDNGDVESAAKGQVNSLISIFSAGSRNVNESKFASISESLSSMISAINNSGDLSPTITPVLDLSNVQEGFSSLSSAFAANKSIALAGDAAYLQEAGRSLNLEIQNGNRNSMNQNITALGSKLDRLGDTILNRQIVLDSGEVVGGLVNPMDRALGIRAIRAQRAGAR